MGYKNISENRKILILTGPASSGKTTLINELKGLGYYTVEESAIEVIKNWKAKNKKLPWEDPENKYLFKKFQKDVLNKEIKVKRNIPKKEKLIIMDRSLEDILAYLYCETGERMLDNWIPTFTLMDVSKEDISVLLLMPIVQDEPKNNEYYPPKEKQWQQYYCLSEIYKKSGYQLYEELEQMDIESRLNYIDEILKELVLSKNSKKKTTEQIIGKNIINMLKEENNIYSYKTKYVIHDHYATHHHFDLRIKKGNKLPSWALPKAYIPQNDGEKILAVRTPDHDLYWMTFKGEIPKGEYGAGTVDIYESGECIIYKWGDHIVVKFLGEKANGFYSLIKTKGNNYILLRMDQEKAQERYGRL